MPRYGGHASYVTTHVDCIAKCEDVRDTLIPAEGLPPMSPQAISMWAAAETAMENIWAVLATMSPGRDAYYEGDIAVTDDPLFRSVQLTLTVRKP